MTKPEDLPYFIEGRKLIAETPDLRVQVLTLEQGQEVPWHYHTIVTDTFICLDGPMAVSTRAPTARHELQAGDIIAVPPDTAHRVTGREGQYCRFAIVQGIGEHDYVAVND